VRPAREAKKGLRPRRCSAYSRQRVEARRSSNPQRGLIRTDPPLWVVATSSVTSST